MIFHCTIIKNEIDIAYDSNKIQNNYHKLFRKRDKVCYKSQFGWNCATTKKKNKKKTQNDLTYMYTCANQ